MVIIGLTGTIASGKSTATKYFKQLGAGVISADEIARELTVPGTPIFQAIVEHFGTDFLLPSGELNRKKLREIIFKDVHEKLWLENILHPAIRKAIQEQIATIKAPYCIVEIPLLKDKIHYSYLDRVLLITTTKEVQLERLMQRDQCSLAQAQLFLSAQSDLENQRSIADDVIENNNSLDYFFQKICSYHQLYVKNSIQLL